MTRGEYMRKARMDAGLSIAELSAISGISKRTLSDMENNATRGGWLITVELLADTLGLSIDEYIGHEVKKHG
jgi:transcriptional regulator with XRE-family HTH domain